MANVLNQNASLADKLYRLSLLHQLSRPGASQRRLAASLGVSVSVVNPLVRRALVGGLVESTGSGRQTQYALTQAGDLERRSLAYDLLLRDTPIYELVRADVGAKVRQLTEKDVRRIVVFGDGPMLELALVALLGQVEVLGRIGPPAYGLRGVGLGSLDELEPDAVICMINEAPADLRRAVKSRGIHMVYFS